jgi:dTDP-4-amino-4,6-dideoxygalactose transaminase
MAYDLTSDAKACAAQVAELCHREYGLLLGSGTTALTLACSMAPSGRKKIIVPAISCLSVLNAVLYAECEPVFVDVLPDTGLLDPESVREAINRDPLIGAVIVAHTYGYVADCHAIAAIARSKGVLVIEDAAQAQGGQYDDGQPLGALGDLSLVSFGHTKILDVGCGGILMTDSKQIHTACLALSEDLPITPSNLNDISAVYRANYYINWGLRNSDRLALARIGKLYLSFREIFLHRPGDATAKRIIAALPSLQAQVTARQTLAAEYAAGLLDIPGIRCCNTPAGSVPWRFVFLAPEGERDALLDHLRSHDLDASSWYPSLTCFHEGDGNQVALPNATAFERQVVNLWLNPGYSSKRIEMACKLIRNYFGE